eukprot:2397738-Rhodomonas_salina.1
MHTPREQQTGMRDPLSSAFGARLTVSVRCGGRASAWPAAWAPRPARCRLPPRWAPAAPARRRAGGSAGAC